VDGTTTLKRSENATSQSVAGEAILIHLPTGKYFSLNRVGTELWEMLDGQRSIAEHAACLAEKYNVDKEMVGQDLLELCQRLLAKNLVEVV
jgi:hypothetical protein